jgi:hypothetical protein
MKTLHTAYRVTDLTDSLAFYTTLGYRSSGGSPCSPRPIVAAGRPRGARTERLVAFSVASRSTTDVAEACGIAVNRGYVRDMRLLRGLGGALLWLLSAVLGLVGVIACVTVILLPLGIPLLGYARRMFGLSLKLILPRTVRHPVETAEGSVHRQGRKARKKVMAKKPGRRNLKKSAKKATQVRRKLPFFS